MVLRDQEIRFTVHDSPDYYRLKVSVFNDDKRTELIGECWVPLESIVVRGGGQNDLWHQLNCRGKFAGEIRIELTYYDTRPRDAKIDDGQQSAATSTVTEVTRDEIRGPRQPKPVKRRPLPANPTKDPLPGQHEQLSTTVDHVHQSPATNLYHQPVEDIDLNMYAEASQTLQYPDRVTYETAQEVGMRNAGFLSNHSSQTYHHSPSHQSSMASLRSDQLAQADQRRMFPPQQGLATEPENRMPSHEQNAYWTETSPFQTEATSQESLHHPLRRPYSDRQLPRLPGDSSATQLYHPSPRHSNGPQPLATYNGRDTQDSEHIEAIDHVAAPPPPPAHRHSGSRTNVLPMRQEPNEFAAESPQSPLHHQYSRSPVAGSPLAQVHTVDPEEDRISLNHMHHPNDMVQSTSRRVLPEPSQQKRQSAPHRERGQSVPSALVPGYERTHSDSMQDLHYYERRRGTALSSDLLGGPPVQPAVPRGDVVGSIPSSASVDRLSEHKGHRYSAPMAVHTQGAQNPRTPQRKSVSPMQQTVPAERRHSAMPFSPDSFDTFNPNMESNFGINQAGPRYATPEQAREQAIQSERERKRGDEPIIGSDGRVIDPSDHLPADTWAPEPEQKIPKRTPEVTLRFKHSPHSTPILPKAGRTPLAETRPNAVSSPPQPPTGDNSPVSGGRARLQKKARMCMPQPNSSPIVPTLDTSRSPRQSMPRHYASEYPLRERENYAYPSNSPTYGDRSPGGIPPPVPGKIPIERGNNYWTDDSALSEELRSIDIGVGSGHRARVKRYGF